MTQTLIYTTQVVKDKFWKDETGQAIPVSRTTKGERLRERAAAKLLADSLKANKQLQALKELVTDVCQQVYDVSLQETSTEGKNRKGNFTWYNFDRSIKVEVSVSERIEFDDLTIQACKEKLNEFIEQGTKTVDDFMRTLILSAFETSGGRLDAKKVLSLKKYKTRTKEPLYHEAMDLLDQSIRRPESKTYFRIWVKDHEGKYQNVDLNFSSI
ncbi:MAG TPA: hypothetical protein DIW47_11030 [Bacteroidetes bacterium]|nr:hypothetical protein [Bacteroidota bacterium]